MIDIDRNKNKDVPELNSSTNNLSVAVCTLGCKVNQYESDCLISEFVKLGFNIKNFSNVCDIYVINTCTVTAQSDKKSKQMIRRAKRLNKDAVIAVCGCFSQIQPEQFKNSGADKIFADIIAGTTDKLKIPETALELIKMRKRDKPTQYSNTDTDCINFVKDISLYREYENINAYSSERTRAYIKIQDGCNAKCSYCVIPLARGGVTSRKYSDILTEVKRFNDMNYHEVVFTGIEIASYGSDLKDISLIELLEKLDNEPSLANIVSMRLSSLDPAYITKDFIDRYAVLKKTANHFHLSLQSGSTDILRLMRRKYNAETILINLLYAKEKISDLNFTADIIVGFPKESENDFNETAEMIKRLNIYHTHIFTYSKRPYTEAAKFEGQIDEAVKNSRSAELSKICEEIKCGIHKNCIGKYYDVIIENFNGQYYTAKTRNYIDVKISPPCMNNDDIELGSIRTVRINNYDGEFLHSRA